MKYTIKPISSLLYLFSFFCFSQINYDNAVNIQQMAKDLYWVKSLTKEVEKDLFVNVPLHYDENLNKVALEKAKSILKNYKNKKEIYGGSNSTNYMFYYDIDKNLDNEQIKIYTEEASKSWAKIEFNNEKFFNDENQLVDNEDINELFNILQSSKVGFAHVIEKNILVVVSYYE